MSDDSQHHGADRSRTSPPGQAMPPRHTESAAGPVRNSDPSADRRAEGSGEEPRQEDLGRRSFAGDNFAADQRRQANERGAGLGAGSSVNYDARHPDDADVDTRGLERDGNGEPLGGMRPEDDLD